jgi:hypothetical protein
MFMTESLWLEKRKDNGTQLLLVKERSKQVLLQQHERLDVLADPWRGQFVCVSTALQQQNCVATVSADGDLKVLADLPQELKWRPCSFSLDGKRLLLAAHDSQGRSCALAVCRADDFGGEQFSVEGILHAGADEAFLAPQFSEARIGVFVRNGDSTQLFFNEWSLEETDKSELVRLGFPGVEMSEEHGWSRSEDGQFIYLLCERPGLNRQQFTRLVSGADEAEPLGEMMAKLDAVAFVQSSASVYFANNSILGVFNFELGRVTESVVLNQKIIIELRNATKRVVHLQITDCAQTHLGSWTPGEDEVKQGTLVSSPVVNWGEFAVDLPHSRTQSLELDQLLSPKDEQLNVTPKAAPTQSNDSDNTNSCDSDFGTLDETSKGGRSLNLEDSDPDRGNENEEGTESQEPGQSNSEVLSAIPVDSGFEDSTTADLVTEEVATVKNEQVPTKEADSSSPQGTHTSAERDRLLDEGETEQGIQVNAVTQTVGSFEAMGSETNVEPDSTKPADRVVAEAVHEQFRAEVVAPSTDFIAWIQQTAEHDDPEVMLRELKPFRGHPGVIDQSVDHLKGCLESLSSNEDLVFEVIIAIAAAAELRAQLARPLLEQMCAAARERLLEHSTLPFVEEHFSLAALRALDQPEGRFSLVVVYEEYEQIIETVTREDVPEDKRNKVLKRTSTRYRRALEYVLFDQGKHDSDQSGDKRVENTETKKPGVESPNVPAQSAPAALAAQAFRFKPLAQRFPSHAQPWQPKGASVSNRASSEILRLEDFGPSGDQSFRASASIGRQPKWIKGVIFGMSGLGAFLSLAVLMLGLQYTPILIAGGLCLTLGSVSILGNAFKHWLGANILFIVGVLSLIAVPSIEKELPEALGPWVFWGPASVFIVFLAVLLNGDVRESFSQTKLFEDEFD